jgi:hypothetical protein
MFGGMTMEDFIKGASVAVVLSIAELVINNACVHPQAVKNLGLVSLIQGCELVDSVHVALSASLPQGLSARIVPGFLVSSVWL